MSDDGPGRVELPKTSLPDWHVGELPEPKRLSWRNWTSFIGPGIVMMGIQIGGGEWLLGPEVTAKYGGGLMWIATVAIIVQVFYNLECARYALYCGEPILTGIMRLKPGAAFWIGFIVMLNLGALIPGLSTHGAAMIVALKLGRPPTNAERDLVMFWAYVCLIGVAVPVLLGGKVYNMLQAIMTAKVLFILGFCLLVGVTMVDLENWWNVFSGFLKFGTVPTYNSEGKEVAVNAFTHFWREGAWPVVTMANIAALGGFAGYAGGGGLANSTYSNFIRDKGWGMGSTVGAIASAIGGKNVMLSHVGRVFAITKESLARWRGWWRYILTDQIAIWGPGCFMGMALPALMSLQFAGHSGLMQAEESRAWAQAMITSDGMRHTPGLAAGMQNWLWLMSLLVGLAVMLPSQMSIVDDISRRYTDVIWTASQRARSMSPLKVKYIYYAILGLYVFWSLTVTFIFSKRGTPKLMTEVIPNLGNVAIGSTSFLILWVNTRLLPKELRPKWYHRCGIICCGVFYLGIAALVFSQKTLPYLKTLF